jgi:hypothetical protein
MRDEGGEGHVRDLPSLWQSFARAANLNLVIVFNNLCVYNSKYSKYFGI